MTEVTWVRSAAANARWHAVARPTEGPWMAADCGLMLVAVEQRTTDGGPIPTCGRCEDLLDEAEAEHG